MVCVCGAPFQLRPAPAASRRLVRCHGGGVAASFRYQVTRRATSSVRRLCVQLPLISLSIFACASKCARSSTCSFTSSLMGTSVISAWVSRMAQSRRAWRRLLMCTQSKRLFDEHFTLQLNTQNAVSAYVVSATFDHNLITTTRTINSRMLQTWAAADSWQIRVSVKARCSAFQTHCSCGPYTANPARAAVWPCRCRAPTACVFEWGPTRAGGLQTERWHRKPGQRNGRS